MDIEKEKSAFLDIYKYYPSAIKFTFDVENECFVLSKKNPLDHEVATISQMNQQWLAWLRRAKLEYEKLNGCVVDFQKEKIAHEKHLLSQGVDFKYLPNIQYNELENVYELIEWCEEYSEALNEINSSWCTWQAAKAQAVPDGFVVVNQKDLLELTIAINAVDLATHTESKTNEVREMWQQVALKLMALGTAQEPAND